MLFDKLIQISNAYKFNFCFIIEQSSIINQKEYQINEIFSMVKKTEKIKLIICPTMNNIFSKNEIESLFNKWLNNNYNTDTRRYYFQEFISEEQSQVLNNESNEYLQFIREIGYLPILYYDSKLSDINSYKDYLKIKY